MSSCTPAIMLGRIYISPDEDKSPLFSSIIPKLIETRSAELSEIYEETLQQLGVGLEDNARRGDLVAYVSFFGDWRYGVYLDHSPQGLYYIQTSTSGLEGIGRRPLLILPANPDKKETRDTHHQMKLSTEELHTPYQINDLVGTTYHHRGVGLLPTETLWMTMRRINLIPANLKRGDLVACYRSSGEWTYAIVLAYNSGEETYIVQFSPIQTKETLVCLKILSW